MEILIKGEWIKLPSKDDYLDIRLYGTGEVVINGDLDREAKAILVPEHGRLGDLDAMFFEIMNMSLLNKHERIRFMSLISQAPTVLEANT